MNFEEGAEWGIRLYEARNPVPSDRQLATGVKAFHELHRIFQRTYDIDTWRARIARGPLPEDTDLDYVEGVRWAYRLVVCREPSEEDVWYHASVIKTPAMLRAFFSSFEFRFRWPDRSYLADTDLYLAFTPQPTIQPPEGMFVTFAGATTRVSFLPRDVAWMAGTIDGVPEDKTARFLNRPEWSGALRSVLEAGERLVVIELGAGWAPWLVNCAVAARRRGVTDMKLIGVEGSSHHAGFMRQHFIDNGINPDAHQLFHAVIGVEDGHAWFPKLKDPTGDYGANVAFDPDDAAATSRGELEKVRCIGLPGLLRETGRVDLIHIDIQGYEREVLEASISELNTLVRRIIIGTHSRTIDAALLDLFAVNGWVLEHEQAPYAVQQPDGSLLFPMDGEQIWRNDRLAFGQAPIAPSLRTGSDRTTWRRRLARVFRRLRPL